MLKARHAVSTTETVLERSAFPELADVEAALKKALQSSCDGLREMTDHLFKTSGKMLRPILVTLSARLFKEKIGGKKYDSLVRVAAAVELIHTASLVHDDIIDGAAHRRGNITLHRRWNIKNATLAGDYLLARAFELLSGLDQNRLLIPLLGRAVSMLCQGEVRQLDKAFAWEMSEKEYFRFNFLKTSQFLGACCEAGGRCMQGFPGQIRALRLYGINLGQAFQVVDDILDYAEDPVKMGKPAGSDLGQGVVTLPLIYLMRKTKRYREILPQISARSESFPETVKEQIKKAVISSGALKEAFQKAKQCEADALKELQHLPPGRPRDMLAWIAGAITARVSF